MKQILPHLNIKLSYVAVVCMTIAFGTILAGGGPRKDNAASRRADAAADNRAERINRAMHMVLLERFPELYKQSFLHQPLDGPPFLHQSILGSQRDAEPEIMPGEESVSSGFAFRANHDCTQAQSWAGTSDDECSHGLAGGKRTLAEMGGGDGASGGEDQQKPVRSPKRVRRAVDEDACECQKKDYAISHRCRIESRPVQPGPVHVSSDACSGENYTGGTSKSRQPAQPIAFFDGTGGLR